MKIGTRVLSLLSGVPGTIRTINENQYYIVWDNGTTGWAHTSQLKAIAT